MVTLRRAPALVVDAPRLDDQQQSVLETRAPLVRQTPTATNPAWEGPGGVGDYARSHGNMWSSVTTAHELRDGVFNGDAIRRQIWACRARR